MPAELSPAEILIKTKEVLKSRGWFQSGMVEPGTNSCGRVCLIGAMNVAMRNNPHDCNYTSLENNEHVAVRAIRNIIDHNSVILWNDSPKRTITEVNSVIDQAIEKLSSK